MCSDVATSGKNTNLGGYLFGFDGIIYYILFECVIWGSRTFDELQKREFCRMIDNDGR